MEANRCFDSGPVNRGQLRDYCATNWLHCANLFSRANLLDSPSIQFVENWVGLLHELVMQSRLHCAGEREGSRGRSCCPVKQSGKDTVVSCMVRPHKMNGNVTRKLNE